MAEPKGKASHWSEVVTAIYDALGQRGAGVSMVFEDLEVTLAEGQPAAVGVNSAGSASVAAGAANTGAAGTTPGLASGPPPISGKPTRIRLNGRLTVLARDAASAG